MSKLKLMYDVINTMKDKEAIRGTLNVEGIKDETKIVGFVNEFEKNLSTGETKVKINTELDYNGKIVKHESQTEFTSLGCHGHHRHHGFMKHMHHHRHGCIEGHDDLKCAGIKEKLTKLAYILNILNQIKVDEKEDQSVLVSLNLSDIPDEVKKVFQERMSQHPMPEHHEHHGLMKELFSLQKPEIQFNLWISKAKDVEKIIITIEGKQDNDPNDSHELTFKAELNLLN
ncbi:hypothetical protein [Desulfosporosinus sp. SB140]|uniref:hypothetical protein n=1 Tax=Desulfosporosinus paludis TaxID=3115649 RepID=UPI00388E0AE5